MATIRILGISGSLRKDSFNTALLNAASGLVTDIDAVAVDVATLHGIPLYDGDVESSHGEPKAVAALKEKMQQYDGVILSTPEYNNGVPGVFKNAIDWLSRPSEAGKDIFANRHVAVLGASPGGFGTVMAQSGWLPILKALGAQQWAGGRLLASRAHTLFNENGEIVDDRMREQLRDFVTGFASAIDAAR